MDIYGLLMPSDLSIGRTGACQHRPAQDFVYPAIRHFLVLLRGEASRFTKEYPRSFLLLFLVVDLPAVQELGRLCGAMVDDFAAAQIQLGDGGHILIAESKIPNVEIFLHPKTARFSTIRSLWVDLGMMTTPR